MEQQIIRYNRKELYKQAWSEPMTKLSKKYGLSDNGLRKICKKLNVPLPYLGYWQKKEFGKKIVQPSLPPYDGDDEIVVVKGVPEKPEADEDQPQIAFVKREENRIKVPQKLNSPHPLIVQSKESFIGAKDSVNGILWSKNKTSLNISVSQNCLRRALRIMDALVKAVEKRGFNISVKSENNNYYGAGYQTYKTIVTILDAEIEIRIREKIKREENDSKINDTWTYSKYVYFPSGNMTLEIMNCWGSGLRQSWTDGKRKKLEDKLNDFIVGLIKAAISEKERELERQEREKRWAEERRQREESERLEYIENEKILILGKSIENWDKSKKIHEFLEAIKYKVQTKDIEFDEELKGWVDWASGYADKLDPFIGNHSSALD